MAGQITMQSAVVNSNVAVELPSSVVSLSWKNLTNVTPVAGKFDIVETDVGGFENPLITINGTIDAGDLGTNKLTQSLLNDFAQIKFDGTSATAIKLTIKSGGDGTTDVYLKGRPTAGYSVGGTYLNYMYVIIDSFSLTFSTNVTNERRWDFQITCHETRLR